MGSIMDGLVAEAYDRHYTDRALIGRIAHYFRARRSLMSAVVLLIVFNSLIDTFFPLLISHGLDVLMASKTLQAVPFLIAAILCASILSCICSFFHRRLTVRAVGDVVLALRKDAFAAIMAHDMSFYDEFSSG